MTPSFKSLKQCIYSTNHKSISKSRRASFMWWIVLVQCILVRYYTVITMSQALHGRKKASGASTSAALARVHKSTKATVLDSVCERMDEEKSGSTNNKSPYNFLGTQKTGKRHWHRGDSFLPHTPFYWILKSLQPNQKKQCKTTMRHKKLSSLLRSK